MVALLWNALRGKGCAVLTSDMKVRTNKGTHRYPDVPVVCGKPEFYGKSETVLTNPLVVVEVLSPGTEATDRGEKLAEYQATESLQSYILVSTNMAKVEQYARQEDGHWDYRATTEGVVTIPALKVILALSDLYENIDVEDAERND